MQADIGCKFDADHNCTMINGKPIKLDQLYDIAMSFAHPFNFKTNPVLVADPKKPNVLYEAYFDSSTKDRIPPTSEEEGIPAQGIVEHS